MKRLRNRKGGFTLVEMIVVVAIFAILMAGILAAVIPTFKFFSATNELASAKSISNNLYTYIKGKVEYADSVTVYTGSAFPGGVDMSASSALEFRASDGHVYFYDKSATAAEAFNAAYYDKFKFAITTTGANTLLTFAITVNDKDDKAVHTSTNALNLVNLELIKKTIDNKPSSGTNTYIVYTLPGATPAP